MKRIIVYSAFILLFLIPCTVQGAQIVSVDLPAGNYMRIGDYFPIRVTLEETTDNSLNEIIITIGDLAFTKTVSMVPGASRGIIVKAVSFEENPEVSIDVRTGRRRYQYPQFSRTLMDKLTVMPRNQHFVGILSNSPNRKLTWLFQRKNIVTVLIDTNLEFPLDVFTVFDLIAFEGVTWNSLDRGVRSAIEKYVKSGGSVFISEHDRMPDVFFKTSWGLGELFLMSSEDSRLLKLPARSNEVKSSFLAKAGFLKPRKKKGLAPSDLNTIFYPLPGYIALRPAWLIYLLVCSMVISAVSLCSLLRVWSSKTGLLLLPIMSVGLSVGFNFLMPLESVAYEKISVISAASNSDTAMNNDFIHLFAFSDTSRNNFQLGANGLILPGKQGWKKHAYGKNQVAPVLSNGVDATISELGLRKGRKAVFIAYRLFMLDGGFELRIVSDNTHLINNSGYDLTDCIIIKSGMAHSLGDLKFGQEVKLSYLQGKPVMDYLQQSYNIETREGRIKSDLYEKYFRKFMKKDRIYLAGWSKSNRAPKGYAQSIDMGILWLIDLEEGN